MSEEVSNPVPTSEPVVAQEAAPVPAGNDSPASTESVVSTDANPVVAEEPKPAQPDKFASRFAELSRKDKAITEKKKALEAQEKELADKAARIAEYEQLKGSAKQNPLAVLKQLGVDIDDVTQAIMTNGLPEKVDPIKQEIESLKSELQKLTAEREAARQEKDKMEQQRLYSDYKQTVETDLNEFPLAKSYLDADVVIDTITKHYHATGEVLSHKEVLSQYEQFYEEKIEAIKNIDKVKQKLGIGVIPEAAPVIEQPVVNVKTEASKQPAAKQPAKTLSNKTATPAPMKSLDDMTEKERLAYAASILKGNK